MNDEEVEERLRDALRLHAAEAPPGAALLGTVVTESARRGRRNRLAAAATAAAVLVAIGAALPFALRDAPGPVPAQPALVAPAPGSAPAEPTLVSSTVPVAVTFPYSPPLAAGYGDPRIMLTAGHPTLRQTRPSGGSATLTLYDATPPAPSSKAYVSRVIMNGQGAAAYDWTFADDDPASRATGLRRSLIWQPADGTWLRLDLEPVAADGELIAYAEQVRPGALKAQAPFTFGLMPKDWTVDNIDPAGVTFAPPGVTPDASYVDKIAVMLDESSGAEPKITDAPTVQVTVGGRRAWLTETADGQLLQVPVEGGRSLLIQIGAKAALPPEALLRFASEIAVTPAAQVGHG
ncbi:hypothetical protein [Dactylosporangium sp. CA-233914]|uniref:hypothetical protein n=1 Tax=Dactylosporangium sp. CA-233914 TaxID=3239934 RepID=UPI003D8F2D17